MEIEGQVRAEATPSILKGDGTFYNRVISRDSSASSRVFYPRAAADGGVPFKWETQPGTPKRNTPNDDRIPPIGLPPAVLSLSLPKADPLQGGARGGGGGGRRGLSSGGKLKLLWRFFARRGGRKRCRPVWQ